MTLGPTKYVPVEYSIVGLSAALLERLSPNDTVSTLWDRVRDDERVRTFDRFAEALTLLYALHLLKLDGGVLLRRREAAE